MSGPPARQIRKGRTWSISKNAVSGAVKAHAELHAHHIVVVIYARLDRSLAISHVAEYLHGDARGRPYSSGFEIGEWDVCRQFLVKNRQCIAAAYAHEPELDIRRYLIPFFEHVLEKVVVSDIGIEDARSGPTPGNPRPFRLAQLKKLRTLFFKESAILAKIELWVEFGKNKEVAFRLRVGIYQSF